MKSIFSADLEGVKSEFEVGERNAKVEKESLNNCGNRQSRYSIIIPCDKVRKELNLNTKVPIQPQLAKNLKNKNQIYVN